MIEVAVGICVGVLVGFYLGVRYAAQNMSRAVVGAVEEILKEQGYEIRGKRIVPKDGS